MSVAEAVAVFAVLDGLGLLPHDDHDPDLAPVDLAKPLVLLATQASKRLSVAVDVDHIRARLAERGDAR